MATIFGTIGHDILNGTSGHNFIDGRGGNDTIYGGDGLDTIYGGNGDDHIYGGNGVDMIYGGSGNDIIFVDDALDYRFKGGDTIDGGGGKNEIRAYSNSTTGSVLAIKLGEVSNIEILYNATAEKSLIIQGAISIDVSSIKKYDTAGGKLSQIWGSDLNDTIKGFDIIQMKNPAGIWETVHFNDIITGGAGNDHIFGNAGDDHLLGESGNDTLDGGIGNDTLMGMAGDDTLIGRDGYDSLYGGAGNDTFLFDYSTYFTLNDPDYEDIDIINDSTQGEDIIHITNTSGALDFDNMLMEDLEDSFAFLINPGTAVFVKGISTADITAADFLFT
ncbi:MAG: calcium-binding protein [Paracoccus sp. (in: a-proteobacteria)]|uniref:calcium-binding protein n=1 Tax=Paracoccus sp. TaxID=267 RepID=UPI0026DEA63F|nr:calcium-binding protein [Paracoccus sp. (in: a-proteobacteria)]MDO5613806.1 calcium-binding protein [Paracoccus sp. (in: a-proteobacteria)]